MGIDEYVNSPEFKRTSRNIIDYSIKRFFYTAGIFFKGTLDFIKSMVYMAIGK